MSNELTRRSFVKWGTATAGATALAGLTSCAPAKEEELSRRAAQPEDFGYPGEKGNGQWAHGGLHEQLQLRALALPSAGVRGGRRSTAYPYRRGGRLH